MEKELVKTKLNEVFVDIFGDDSIEITEGTTADHIDAWDSLQHVRLILEVENRFGFQFSVGEAGALRNVGELIDEISKRSDG